MLAAMSYRVTFVAIFSGLSFPLTAQTPTGCIGQPIPLKPVGIISCPAAVPECLTDSNGMHGRWIWSCRTPTPTASQIGLIPLLAQPPSPIQITNPLDVAIQAEKLQQLRLENQQVQQQLEARSIPSDTPSARPASTWDSKAIYSCGFFDGMLQAMKAMNTNDALATLAIQQTLKDLKCDQFSTSRAIEGNINNPPIAQNRLPENEQPLDNAGIVNMVKSGLPEDAILSAIKIRPPRYWLTPVDRHDLQRAGVSDSIIKAMEVAGH